MWCWPTSRSWRSRSAWSRLARPRSRAACRRGTCSRCSTRCSRGSRWSGQRAPRAGTCPAARWRDRSTGRRARRRSDPSSPPRCPSPGAGCGRSCCCPRRRPAAPPPPALSESSRQNPASVFWARATIVTVSSVNRPYSAAFFRWKWLWSSAASKRTMGGPPAAGAEGRAAHAGRAAAAVLHHGLHHQVGVGVARADLQRARRRRAVGHVAVEPHQQTAVHVLLERRVGVVLVELGRLGHEVRQGWIWQRRGRRRQGGGGHGGRPEQREHVRATESFHGAQISAGVPGRHPPRRFSSLGRLRGRRVRNP